MQPRPDRVARRTLRAEVDHGVAELVGDPDRPQGWTLLVDGTAQSHVDLDDPTHLEFEYVRRLGHVVDLIAPAGARLRALHLGGGAWTLARYLAATRPGSTQRVAELDGALAELVEARLPADGLGIEVAVGDARAVLQGSAPGSLDLLVLDAFAGSRIPSHLTSVEFLRSAAAVLDRNGVYAANLADGGPLDFARTQVAAALAQLSDVVLVAAPDVLHGRRFGNLVLVGADRELPVADLVRRVASDPFPARVLTGAELRRFAGCAVAPTDRAAVPSPLPPPGFFGRPALQPPAPALIQWRPQESRRPRMTHTHYAGIEAADGGRFDAYCAVPDRDPAPGVLLFQEIFGINDNIRGLAEKLADAGFLVLAPDMFWRLERRFERKDESGLTDAMSMVQRLDFTLARADMAATLTRLRTMPGCTGRVGAVGFCLGGTLTFLAAATAKPDGRGLDAAVPYYGSGIHEMLELVPAVECPMLLHYGDQDPYITAEQITQVEQALADRKDVTVHHYDAGHAFSNWDAPSMYRAGPAELAWTRTVAFLTEQLS